MDRIFHVISGTVTLQRLVISGGLTVGMGGGVAMEMLTSLTMQDDRVTNNTSFYGGGGISDWYGTLTLKNVQIDGNTFHGGSGGIYGGAGLFSYGGTNHLNSVIITDNHGINGIGGGTYMAGVIGTTDFTDVTISNNTASGGGGMVVRGATITLTNVSLVSNSGQTGGGIWQYYGNLTIINSTISSNSATYFAGGGLYQDSGDGRLINVTMNDNSATPGQGGAIYFFNKGTMVLTNRIVANSPATGNCNTAIGGNFNLSSDNSCGFGAGRETLNVMLGPLGYHGGSTLTHLPLLGSPAINFGANSSCPSTDQRGLTRPIGSVCDVGAV